ncbi:MAG: TIGR03560 family F420-dependent LLM class oxidoreductase [Actinomycetota bacterium]
MRISAKLAPVFDISELVRFWRAADRMGFHGVYNYDHFYGLGDSPDTWEQPTLEAWTTLAAMAVHTERARIGCMVSAVTFRNPGLIAKMATTIDHLSAGRLDIGLGAGWHEPEHSSLGFGYPPPGTRIAMLDEACTIIRGMFTQQPFSFSGEHFSVTDARCQPTPIQEPHPRLIIGGNGRNKTLRIIAKHADEWNCIGTEPETFAELSRLLDGYCREVGRDPSEITRGAQMFLHPAAPEQIEEQLDRIPALADAGCEHLVLSFYQPPSEEVLERCAPRN